MPTSEQYIEAARRKLKADTIVIDLADNTHKVSFYNQTPDCRTRDPISVTPEEAEAVALEPKQEWKNELCMMCLAQVPHNHAVCFDCADRPGLEPKPEHLSSTEMTEVAKKFAQSCHNHNICDCCKRMTDAAFEAGKASLKPFDVEALGILIAHTDMDELTSHEIAQEIADNFAAPERKPITVTDLIKAFGMGFDRMLNNMQSYDEMAGKLSAYLNLQPAPVEAERCPRCDHDADAITRTGECVWDTCDCLYKFHRERGTV